MEKREILKETDAVCPRYGRDVLSGYGCARRGVGFPGGSGEAGKRYVFFTNNSSKSPKTYIDKLAKMGCYIKRNQIITSGDVMIQYLKDTNMGVEELKSDVG